MTPKVPFDGDLRPDDQARWAPRGGMFVTAVRPEGEAKLELVIFVLIAAVVVLPTLATMLAEFRDDRRRCAGSPRRSRRPDAETVAVRSLLAGLIDREEYRHMVATIAAHDEIAHPVRVPLG